MKKAVEAWLKADPFNDPKAPPGPFKMDEYRQPEMDEVKRQDEESAKQFAAAQHANETSDTYVLLTVLFASTLFFAGIAGTIDSHPIRVSILVIALAFFAVTLMVLATMPICHE